VSRVIGFVYYYTFHVTSLLSLLTILAFLGGIATLKCANSGNRCDVPFGKLASGRQPLSTAAERCGASISRVSFVIQS